MASSETWTCSRCGATPEVAHIPARGTICLGCRRKRGREHYEANRAYYIRKAMDRNRTTTELVRNWLLSYLDDHPCVDCGTRDIRVLEFDHREPERKRAEISVLATNGYSLSTVQNEVLKCDVRCANCHLIRTRNQHGWWRGEEKVRARHDSNVQPFDP